MQAMTRAIRQLLIGLCLVAIGWGVINYWSFIFSKTIRGEVMEIERVMQPTTVIGSNITASQMFSFAVLMRSEDGVPHSASSEDRQWAIVKKGMCIEARFYPYPPWDLEKSGTYFNARLLTVLNDCKRLSPTGTPAGAASVPPTVEPGAGTPDQLEQSAAAQPLPSQPVPAQPAPAQPQPSGKR